MASFLKSSPFSLNNLSRTLKPSLTPAFFFKVSNISFLGFIFIKYSNLSTATAISLFFFNSSKKSFFNLSSLSFFALVNISFNLLTKLIKLSCFIFCATSLHLLKYSLKSLLSFIFCILSKICLNLSSFSFFFFNKSFILFINLSIISFLLAISFHSLKCFFKSFLFL